MLGPTRSAEEEARFGHPDDTAFLDALDDPIRAVADLQKLGPIVRGEALGGHSLKFGEIILPNILAAPCHLEGGTFAAVTWDAGRAVYTRPESFSSTIFAAGAGKHWGRNISMMDPPEHTALRTVMQQGFVPKYVASWQDRIIKPVLERRFAALRPRGRAELVRDLTADFPYEIVGRVVGFDPDDVAFVGAALNRIMQGFADPAGAEDAGVALRSYAAALIEARRRAPQNDFVSALTCTEVEGASIPDDTFVGMVIHLMQGAMDTVFRMSSTLVWLLLAFPDECARVRADRSLIPALVEEALRYEGVSTMLPRLVADDADLMGVKMPRGSVIWVTQAAINRDPARWTDPHRFDVTRPRLAHFAFGNGPHSCIGMHLARSELARFVAHVFDDLPNLRWDRDLERPPRITGWTMRGITSLPVEWDERD